MRARCAHSQPPVHSKECQRVPAVLLLHNTRREREGPSLCCCPRPSVLFCLPGRAQTQADLKIIEREIFPSLPMLLLLFPTEAGRVALIAEICSRLPVRAASSSAAAELQPFPARLSFSGEGWRSVSPRGCGAENHYSYHGRIPENKLLSEQVNPPER